MEEKNIIDFLFERREENAHFKSFDKELKNSSQIMIKSENELINFIEKKIHPKSQEKLKMLIEEKETSVYDYFYRENQLFYRCGFLDAMNLALSIFSPDKNSIYKKAE